MKAAWKQARHWLVLLGACGALGASSACDAPEPAPVRSEETRAVEAEAGDFLDYYDEVLSLARTYAAQPDSFRAALAELPGSHLTEEQWDAWTEPYADDPVHLASHIEALLAKLASQ